MEPNQEQTVSSWNIFKPFYWILRTFGLAAFSIEGDITNGEIKTRIHDVLHLMLVLSLQTYALYVNIKIDFSFSLTGKFLIDEGAHGLEIFNAFILVLCTCVYAFHKESIWRIIAQCSIFDIEVLS